MADVFVTLKIMPESPETDLEKIKVKASELIANFEGKVHKSEEKPVAFGLKALEIMFIMNEAKGSTEKLETQISEMDDVVSVDVIDVRRAIG